MGKRFAFIAAAAIFCTSNTSAFAEDPLSQQITINGTVSTIGTMGAPTFQVQSNATPVGSNVTIPSLVKTDQTAAPFQFTATFPIVINSTAKVKIFSANGCLKNSASVSGSNFANSVGYTATANVGSSSNVIASTILTADTCAANIASDASDQFSQYSGNVELFVGNADISNTNKLVAGNYSDTLTVYIGSN